MLMMMKVIVMLMNKFVCDYDADDDDGMLSKLGCHFPQLLVVVQYSGSQVIELSLLST